MRGSIKMSTIDLVLLGFVWEKPRSAYEIQKHIEHSYLSHSVKISSPAVYKNIGKLENSGYLSSESVRKGKMPEKTLYSISQEGRDYFSDLMTETSKKDINIFMDFNTIIYNIHKLPQTEALRLIESIKANIIKSKGHVQAHIEKNEVDRLDITRAETAILEQHIILFNSLLIWIDNFIKEVEIIHE